MSRHQLAPYVALQEREFFVLRMLSSQAQYKLLFGSMQSRAARSSNSDQRASRSYVRARGWVRSSPKKQKKFSFV